MTKIILFKNGIETLGFFSIQLSIAFEELGYETFMFDLLEEEESFRKLQQFCDTDDICMITFNFTGLRGEACFYPGDEENYWDRKGIRCMNIVVDHPFYYHELMEHVPKRYEQMCIDSYHDRYVARFFPEINRIPWIPLGGTPLTETKLTDTSWKQREYEIVFTGNYTPPKTFEQHITRINEEYTEFYRRIIDDLIEHTEQPMEEVMEKYLKEEMPNLNDHDLRECMGSMIFIDLYVRFFYRGLVVKTLVDSGLIVHCFGAGWELLECEHPENLVIGGSQSSKECLQKISKAKISLNVMPWFKDGAHDRIFNSMLNGAVSLTDGSQYLHEQFTNQEDILFYSLKELEHLPERIHRLLQEDQQLESIAKQGYDHALRKHTWKERAIYLEKYIK